MPVPPRAEKGTTVIIATGIDIADQQRIQRLLDHHGARFLERVFTAAEQEYCLRKARPAESLAARFAAKEAVMKCLGTGFGDGVAFRQIEVVRGPRGAPSIRLTARAADVAAGLGIQRWHVSLTHDAGRSLAVVVAEA